jgi:hypothetical protein
MKTRSLPLSSLLLTFLTFLVVLSAQAQVPSYVPTSGLVGYWPFNGNANDESGNGLNLTQVGSASLSADRFNNLNSAFYFGAVTEPSNLNFPSQANQAINNFNQGTLSMWINIHEFDVTNHYFGFDNSFFVKQKGGANTQLYCGILGGTQKFRFHLNGSLPAGGVFSSNSDIQANSWTYVVVTWDGTTERMFVNGILDNSIASANYLTDLANPDFINVGACYPVGSNASYSDIDDIGIWNRALTADEILALYSGCNVSPIAITGSNIPSAFATSTYTCDNTAGSTFNWTVSNGVIASGQGTNSVSILWGAEGVGSVSVVETTSDGCVGDAVIFDVNVQCVVSGNAIEGPVGPEAFSNSTYTCNGAANSSYQWTITNGVIVSGQGTNSVTILWASTGIGNVSVVETTYEGCVGTTLSQDVVVIPTNVEELSNALVLYPNPATTELNLQTTSDLIGADLFIFDALGKQILKQQVLSANTRINTSAFSAGNYVVKVGGVVKKFTVEK